MSFTRYGRVDDAWLGLVMAKLNIDMIKLKDVHVHGISTGAKQVMFASIEGYLQLLRNNGAHQ